MYPNILVRKRVVPTYVPPAIIDEKEPTEEPKEKKIIFDPLSLELTVNSKGLVTAKPNRALVVPDELSLNRTFFESVFDFSIQYSPRDGQKDEFENLQSVN